LRAAKAVVLSLLSTGAGSKGRGADPMRHWNGVTDCAVWVVQPQKVRAYSWK